LSVSFHQCSIFFFILNAGLNRRIKGEAWGTFSNSGALSEMVDYQEGGKIFSLFQTLRHR
jgi:hypothetical protein